jgi:hypothetical protein
MIILSDLINALLTYLPDSLKYIGALVTFSIMIYICFQIIYYRLAEYHYRIRDEELVFERVVGRSNHAFIVIPNKDLIGLEPYNTQKIVKRDFFAHKKKAFVYYVLTFTQHNRQRQIVIMPNDEFVKHLEGLGVNKTC